MSFTPLQSLLPKAASKWNAGNIVLSAEVCEKYRKAVLKVFGDEALAHTWPKWFKNMILTVGVENSVWSQEVYMQKIRILAIINKGLGRKVVVDLRSVVENL